MKTKANEERKKRLKELRESNKKEETETEYVLTPEQDAALDALVAEGQARGDYDTVSTPESEVGEDRYSDSSDAKESYNNLALAITENPKNGWWQVVSIKFNLVTRKVEFGDVLFESPLKSDTEMRFRMEAAYAFRMGDT